jgi:antitoxin CptB
VFQCCFVSCLSAHNQFTGEGNNDVAGDRLLYNEKRLFFTGFLMMVDGMSDKKLQPNTGGSDSFSDGSDREYQRVYWHSRRGMLELDLVLLPFVENCFPSLSDEDKARYVRMLECEDQDMFAWFLKRETPEDKEVAHIVDIIIRYVQSPKN